MTTIGNLPTTQIQNKYKKGRLVSKNLLKTNILFKCIQAALFLLQILTYVFITKQKERKYNYFHFNNFLPHHYLVQIKVNFFRLNNSIIF